MRIVLCGAIAALFGISALTQAAPVPGQGTWETTLLGRDINGHPVSITDQRAEFAYDTVLDATWYLTPRSNGGSSVSDFLPLALARSWASGLTVGTFSGWSLPESDVGCNSDGGFSLLQYNCTTSQMGQLYYRALGNVAYGPLTNTGPFKQLQTVVYYWSGTDYPLPPHLNVGFDFGTGYQFPMGCCADRDYKDSLAIRPGDILVAVPEPGTYAMLLAGLFGVVVLRRRSLPSMGRLFPMLA